MNRILISDDGQFRIFQVIDDNGVVVGYDEQMIHFPPLQGHQINAALNAALGVWPLSDAANVAATSQEHLIAEVEAWAVASTMVGY